MRPYIGLDDTHRWDGERLGGQLLIAYARRVPPHPFKIRLFRWLSRRYFGAGLGVSNRSGVRMRVDPLDYIGHEICFSGAYEPRSVKLACELLGDGGTFVDVGANFGLYTCPIAGIPGVRCIAIDAAAKAVVKLQWNLTLNPDLHVDVVNVALGPGRGFVCLETPNPGNLGTTRVMSQAVDVACTQRVASVPLNEVLDDLAIDRITLMKIDVEGYEAAVFAGLDFDGPHRPDNIIMEYSDRILSEFANLKTCFDLLSRHGYEPFSVSGERFEGVMPLPEENLWWRHRDTLTA